jgi:hypothetical protein
VDTTYSIDGISLDDAAGRWWLERDDPFQSRPAVRSAAISVPGRDGFVPLFNETYEVNTIALKLIVTGRSPDGGSGETYAQLVHNVENLMAVVSERHRLMTLTRTMGGAIRETGVRVVTSTDPVQLDHRTVRVVVVFEMTEPFWREVSPVTLATPTLSSGELWSNSNLTLGSGNAPIRDALIVASGTLSQLYAEDEASGTWIRLQATSSSGQGLHIDCGARRAWRTGSDPFDLSGATEVSGSLDTGPGGFTFTPRPFAGASTTRVSLRLRRTGSSGIVRVRARRAWL